MNTGTPEHPGTPKHSGTPEQSKKPGTPILMVLFCCPITDHVKNKMSMQFVYQSITKELSARYKVYVYEIELEIRSVVFCGGRKTGEPGEKQTTNSTFI